MTDKLKELIFKISKLAQEGVGGEKTSAQAMLEKLMKKHNIKEEDLLEIKEIWYAFEIPRKDKWIFEVVYQHLLPPNTKYYCKDTHYGFKLTPETYLELLSFYEFYKARYYEDLKIFNRAFITTNKLYLHPDTQKALGDYDIDEETLKTFRKASLMSETMERHYYCKQLEVKDE